MQLTRPFSYFSENLPFFLKSEKINTNETFNFFYYYSYSNMILIRHLALTTN